MRTAGAIFIMLFAKATVALADSNVVETTSNVAYSVSLPSTSSILAVEACMTDSDSALASQSQQAYGFVKLGPKSGLKKRYPYLQIISATPRCVNYNVDLSLAAKKRFAYRIGQSWLINNHAWMWSPKHQAINTVTFFNEEKMPAKLSTPWVKTNDIYRVDMTPPSWTSRIVIGEFSQHVRQVNNTNLNIALLDPPKNSRQKALVNWVASSFESVARITNTVAQNDIQVIVAPIGKRKEAVPWAEIQRGGSPAVHFFIDPNRPIKEFYDDWTATHEFAHLLLPKVHYRDRWASEGLASYYQYIVKARSGMISSEIAWQQFIKGLGRGRNKSLGSLAESRRTRHVYWGGASLYFLADIALREQNNGMSLDIVLSRFADLHMPSHKTWDAEHLFAIFDQLSDSQIFSTLLKTKLQQPSFPLSESDVDSLHPNNHPAVNAIFSSYLSQQTFDNVLKNQ